MSNVNLNRNIYIDHDVIKQVVADCIRKTPGIANVKKFFFNDTVNAKDSSNKVIHVDSKSNGVIEIEFSIAVHFGHLVLEIPRSLQDTIINSIKYHFNLDCVVNITVSDVISVK